MKELATNKLFWLMFFVASLAYYVHADAERKRHFYREHRQTIFQPNPNLKPADPIKSADGLIVNTPVFDKMLKTVEENEEDSDK